MPLRACANPSHPTNALPAHLATGDLRYHAMRMAWCRAALKSLLKRWSVYLLVGLVVLGGASNYAVAAIMAMAAWSVLPLFQATAQSLLNGVLIGLVYGAVGGALIAGLAPALWPRAWADAERALPIDPQVQRASDTRVTLMALLPVFAMYLGGTIIWVIKAPGWLMPALWPGMTLLLLSAMLSVGLGVALLTRRRTLEVVATSAVLSMPGPDAVPGTTADWGTAPQAATMSPCWALIVLPMRRGTARQTGRFFATGLLATGAGAFLLGLLPAFASWWLAGFAALSLMVTTRLNALVQTQLKPMHEACVALPIDPAALARARGATVAIPLLAGIGLLMGNLWICAGTVHLHVLGLYVSALLVGNALLVVTANRETALEKDKNAGARVSWWLLIGVLQIALASEVMV